MCDRLVHQLQQQHHVVETRGEPEVGAGVALVKMARPFNHSAILERHGHWCLWDDDRAVSDGGEEMEVVTVKDKLQTEPGPVLQHLHVAVIADRTPESENLCDEAGEVLHGDFGGLGKHSRSWVG